jgi:hypothetical protein
MEREAGGTTTTPRARRNALAMSQALPCASVVVPLWRMLPQVVLRGLRVAAAKTKAQISSAAAWKRRASWTCSSRKALQLKGGRFKGDAVVRGDLGKVQLAGGGGTLSGGTRGRYGGSEIVLASAFRLPEGPGGCLHLSMAIDGIRESTGKAELSVSARIFITPDDVSGIADAYGTADAVAVQVTRDPDGVSVSLSEKTQPGNGSGRMLYSDNADGAGFPLRFDLYLGADPRSLRAGRERHPVCEPLRPPRGGRDGRRVICRAGAFLFCPAVFRPSSAVG